MYLECYLYINLLKFFFFFISTHQVICLYTTTTTIIKKTALVPPHSTTTTTIIKTKTQPPSHHHNHHHHHLSCHPKCSHGRCSGSPHYRCLCQLGWSGSDCSIDCNCNYHSHCTTGACDHCYNGTTGARCHKCLPGFYGQAVHWQGARAFFCFYCSFFLFFRK